MLIVFYGPCDADLYSSKQGKHSLGYCRHAYGKREFQVLDSLMTGKLDTVTRELVEDLVGLTFKCAFGNIRFFSTLNDILSTMFIISLEKTTSRRYPRSKCNRNCELSGCFQVAYSNV